ncbi:MAG TPA: hypothetical protein VF605_06085 [Allosphingosinicella sp.]|jgi:hypothetical protein
MLRALLQVPQGKFSNRKIVDVLNELGDPGLRQLDEQVLSKMFHGTGADRLEKAHQPGRVMQRLASLLDEEVSRVEPNFWTDRRSSPEELARELGSSTSSFLAYMSKVTATGGSGEPASEVPLSDEHDLPVLPSVSSIPREDAERLFGLLGGKCLLYRLGMDPRTTRRKGSVNTKYVPVLRRIPVLIEDVGKRYLKYRDQYDFYEEEPERDWADGYFFYTKEHYTVVAADYDRHGVIELFLIQIREKPVPAMDPAIYQGLMVMHGDMGVPTACKVLFRRAPEDLQQLEWDEFTSTCQSKVDLKELPGGGYALKETTPDATDGAKLAEYANFLQIKKATLDLELR